MTGKLLWLLALLIPVCSHGQSAFSDCERVFTKVEHLPSLKISDEGFEDTLAALLTSKDFPFENNSVVLKFVVTRKPRIDDLVVVSGSVEDEKTLQDAIETLGSLWKPAIQDGTEVCAYVSLNIKIVNKTIGITIMQQ